MLWVWIFQLTQVEVIVLRVSDSDQGRNNMDDCCKEDVLELYYQEESPEYIRAADGFFPKYRA
jgi:hypothetical protein